MERRPSTPVEESQDAARHPTDAARGFDREARPSEFLDRRRPGLAVARRQLPRLREAHLAALGDGGRHVDRGAALVVVVDVVPGDVAPLVVI